jgi:hypothetical protein
VQKQNEEIDTHEGNEKAIVDKKECEEPKEGEAEEEEAEIPDIALEEEKIEEEAEEKECDLDEESPENNSEKKSKRKVFHVDGYTDNENLW